MTRRERTLWGTASAMIRSGEVVAGHLEQPSGDL